MAIGILMMMPGTTQEQYDEMSERIMGTREPGPEDAPRGLIIHTAGPAESGWYVYDVWESKGDFDRFMDERVMPAMQDVAPPAGGGEPQVFEIHNLYKPA